MTRLPDPLILSPGDPLTSARAFIEHGYSLGGSMALRHHTGVFYGYRAVAGAYAQRDEGEIRAELYRFLEPAKRWESNGRQMPGLQPFHPTRTKVDNVLDAVRAECNLASSLTAPCWLGSAGSGLDPLDVLACQNGLLHVPKRNLLSPTPDLFTLNALEFAYDPQAPPPENWLHFLAQIWPDDLQSRDTLQEIFGYLLTPRTRFQKIFMLLGPKRSGKGTIGRLLRCLLGERNVCGPTMSNLTEHFGLAGLIGKTLAIFPDARISRRTDTAVVTERLLSISGEDALSVPRKFLSDWTGRLSARLLILTNELLSIEDSSGALASRFLILTLRESFLGREDPDLLDRLVPELPGILNWALEGHDRLAARGRFQQPRTSAETARQFEDLSSPIQEFIRDECELGGQFMSPQGSVFGAWCRWCRRNGRDHPGTIQAFGKKLRAALPGLRISHPRLAGKQVGHWGGLRVKRSDGTDGR